MQPLENKNDEMTYNNDKRSFIPFKRSKQVIKPLLSITKSALTLLSNTLKQPDPESTVRKQGYTCYSRHSPLTITIYYKSAWPVSFHHQGRSIYALNPERS